MRVAVWDWNFVAYGNGKTSGNCFNAVEWNLTEWKVSWWRKFIGPQGSTMFHIMVKYEKLAVACSIRGVGSNFKILRSQQFCLNSLKPTLFITLLMSSLFFIATLSHRPIVISRAFSHFNFLFYHSANCFLARRTVERKVISKTMAGSE